MKNKETELVKRLKKHGSNGFSIGWDAATMIESLLASARPRGRPTVPADQRRDCTVRARVTAKEESKFVRLGGAEWLRSALKRARET